MVNFTIEKVTEHIDRIRGLGDACMYYVHGDKKAYLLDTAYGVGDLKGFVESIAKTPYEVIITHGHADHVNGVNQWDKVYMSHKDIEISKLKSDIGLRRTMLKRTVPNIDEYPDSEFHGPFEGEYIDIQDGDIFDCGDVKLQAIYAPGHTQGMFAFLVKEDRTILFGDACGVCTFLFKPESSTVAVYKETCLGLKKYDTEYDRILRNHGTCESPKSLLDENIETAEEILNGTDEHEPFEYLGESWWIAHKINPETHSRYDGKTGNIVYSMEKIK